MFLILTHTHTKGAVISGYRVYLGNTTVMKDFQIDLRNRAEWLCGRKELHSALKSKTKLQFREYF